MGENTAHRQCSQNIIYLERAGHIWVRLRFQYSPDSYKKLMHVQYDLVFLLEATQRVKVEEQYFPSIAACQLGL